MTSVAGQKLVTLHPRSKNLNNESRQRESYYTMNHSLIERKTRLEHDIEFLKSEIDALISTEEQSFQKLRQGLVIRYSSLKATLENITLLLEKKCKI